MDKNIEENTNNQLKYTVIRSEKGTIATFEQFFEGHSADSAIYDLWELQIQSFLISYCIVHPESFRSNTQNAKRVCTQKLPTCRTQTMSLRAFMCIRLRSFASTVCDRPRAHTVCACVRVHVRI